MIVFEKVFIWFTSTNSREMAYRNYRNYRNKPVRLPASKGNFVSTCNLQRERFPRALSFSFLYEHRTTNSSRWPKNPSLPPSRPLPLLCICIYSIYLQCRARPLEAPALRNVRGHTCMLLCNHQVQTLLHTCVLLSALLPKSSLHA